MRKLLLAVTLGLILGIASMAFAVDAEDLIYITEEYRPYNYTENGQPTGISVDLLKLIWEKIGAKEQPIQVFPWARGYRLVQAKPNHVLFATSRTKERDRLFKWVGPLYVTRFVLIGLTNTDLRVNKLEDAKTYQIGTIKEDIAEQLLLTAGFDKKKLQGVANMDANIRKLQKGRIDLIAYGEKGFSDLVEAKNLDPKQFRVVFVIEEKGSYYAFHKETPDALIQQFQGALDSLEIEHKKILTKYLNE
jgi:polar amino acid transport system substrate-binding protein